MTSKLTREQAEDTIEGLEGLISRGVQSVYLDMAIAGMRQLIATLDSEPVAEVCEDYALRYISHGPAPKEGLQPGDKLYRHAQPAPVVQKPAHSSVIAEQLANVLLELKVTGHQRAVISCAVDRLNNVAQLLQLSPSALLVPEILDYQGAKELYNYLMTEEETNATVNGWNACRAAMLQAGNSPAQIDASPAPHPLDHGYRPDCECAGCKATVRICAELAGWIPVSERLPEKSGMYQVWNGKHMAAHSFFFGSFQCINPEQITHWMPLPAAPQEVKGE